MSAKTNGKLRDHIKSHGSKSGRRALEVPEWDATVYLHEMSVLEAEEFAGLAGAIGDGEKSAAKLSDVVDMLMRVIRDDGGAPVFADAEDRDWLLSQPIRLVNRLAKEAFHVEEGEPEAVKNG